MRFARETCVLLICLIPGLVGCGAAPSTTVTSTEVKRDPSLGEDYYDQQKYDAAIKGDAK
jgi:hypothetical protein